jgi:tRNA(Ile)-lysidine synthase
MNNQSLVAHVESELPSDCRNILVAVSGGVDSVVLLHVLCQLRERHNLELYVAHLDHRIRVESDTDAQFVLRLCEDWQVFCRVERMDVPGMAKAQGESLEMAGRHARRAMFAELSQLYDCGLVALAHHQDDQIETFLLRLVRGSGQAGLVGMRKRSGLWWRPLLGVSRQQIVAYAAACQLEWVEDCSNSDPVYLRNRVRHQILPLLRDMNPAFNQRTATLIEQFREDDDYWAQQVDERFADCLISADDGFRLARSGLLQLHPALRVRVIREALQRVRGSLSGIESNHLYAVVQILSGERSQAQLDLPGCWVARRYETLWFRLLAPEALPDYNELLPVPGRLTLPNGNILSSSWQPHVCGETAACIELDGQKLKQPLRVRSWQAGDRFVPQGMTGRKKIKSYLGDAKVELEERRQLLVLVAGDEIVWLIGHRRSALAVVSATSQNILRVEVSFSSCSGTKNL